MVKIAIYKEEHHVLAIGSRFFAGWPNPPHEQAHRKILEESFLSLIAVDEIKRDIVGFLTVISDGVLAAYIPLLEVLPAYRKKGVGRALLKKAFDLLQDFYMVDLLCEHHLQPFYKKAGMQKASGMMLRNYARQQGNS